MTFTRVGAPDVFMFNTTVTVGKQVVPADVVANGCTVPFVVRAVSSTPGVKAILQIQVSTIQAYNAYGGKRLYDYNSSGGVRASKVSFDRPFTEAFNNFFDVYCLYLGRWR